MGERSTPPFYRNEKEVPYGLNSAYFRTARPFSSYSKALAITLLSFFLFLFKLSRVLPFVFTLQSARDSMALPVLGALT